MQTKTMLLITALVVYEWTQCHANPVPSRKKSQDSRSVFRLDQDSVQDTAGQYRSVGVNVDKRSLNPQRTHRQAIVTQNVEVKPLKMERKTVKRRFVEPSLNVVPQEMEKEPLNLEREYVSPLNLEPQEPVEEPVDEELKLMEHENLKSADNKRDIIEGEPFNLETGHAESKNTESQNTEVEPQNIERESGESGYEEPLNVESQNTEMEPLKIERETKKIRYVEPVNIDRENTQRRYIEPMNMPPRYVEPLETLNLEPSYYDELNANPRANSKTGYYSPREAYRQTMTYSRDGQPVGYRQVPPLNRELLYPAEENINPGYYAPVPGTYYGKRNIEPVYYTNRLANIPVEEMETPERINEEEYQVIPGRNGYYVPLVREVDPSFENDDRGPVEYRRADSPEGVPVNGEAFYYDEANEMVPGDKLEGRRNVEYDEEAEDESAKKVQGHASGRQAGTCPATEDDTGTKLKRAMAELEAKINIESEEAEKYDQLSAEAQKKFMEHRERFRILHTEQTITQQEGISSAQRATQLQSELCRLEKMMCQIREKLAVMHTKKVELESLINSRVKREANEPEEDEPESLKNARVKKETNEPEEDAPKLVRNTRVKKDVNEPEKDAPEVLRNARVRKEATEPEEDEPESLRNTRVKKEAKDKQDDAPVDENEHSSDSEPSSDPADDELLDDLERFVARRAAGGKHRSFNMDDDAGDQEDQFNDKKPVVRQSCQQNPAAGGYQTNQANAAYPQKNTFNPAMPAQSGSNDMSSSGMNNMLPNTNAPAPSGMTSKSPCEQGACAAVQQNAAESACQQKHPCKCAEEVANEEKEFNQLKKLIEEIYLEEASHKLLYEEWVKKDRAVAAENKRLDTITAKLNQIKDNIRAVQQDAMTAWQRVKLVQEQENCHDEKLYNLRQQLDQLRTQLTAYRAGTICARNKRREPIKRRYRRSAEELKTQLWGNSGTFSDIFQDNLPGVLVESSNNKNEKLSSSSSLKPSNKFWSKLGLMP